MDAMKALMEENARLKAKLAAKASGKLSLKVSEKGGLSLYGLQRWPVTLYAPQWLTLMGNGNEITKFIENNKAKLSWEKAEVPATE